MYLCLKNTVHRETVRLASKYEVSVKNEGKFIATSWDICHASGAPDLVKTDKSSKYTSV
jgi:hypothetical protein